MLLSRVVTEVLPMHHTQCSSGCGNPIPPRITLCKYKIIKKNKHYDNEITTFIIFLFLT